MVVGVGLESCSGVFVCGFVRLWVEGRVGCGVVWVSFWVGCCVGV